MSADPSHNVRVWYGRVCSLRLSQIGHEVLDIAKLSAASESSYFSFNQCSKVRIANCAVVSRFHWRDLSHENRGRSLFRCSCLCHGGSVRHKNAVEIDARTRTGTRKESTHARTRTGTRGRSNAHSTKVEENSTQGAYRERQRARSMQAKKLLFAKGR